MAKFKQIKSNKKKESTMKSDDKSKSKYSIISDLNWNKKESILDKSQISN